ncbi:hypothetical protein D3C71_1082550 [compost metagenome]
MTNDATAILFVPDLLNHEFPLDPWRRACRWRPRRQPADAARPCPGLARRRAAVRPGLRPARRPATRHPEPDLAAKRPHHLGQRRTGLGQASRAGTRRAERRSSGAAGPGGHRPGTGRDPGRRADGAPFACRRRRHLAGAGVGRRQPCRPGQRRYGLIYRARILLRHANAAVAARDAAVDHGHHASTDGRPGHHHGCRRIEASARHRGRTRKLGGLQLLFARLPTAELPVRRFAQPVERRRQRARQLQHHQFGDL